MSGLGSSRSGGSTKRETNRATVVTGTADGDGSDGDGSAGSDERSKPEGSGVGPTATIGAGNSRAPSPAIAYTVPRSVPRNTRPFATAMQQLFELSTSKADSSPPLAASN